MNFKRILALLLVTILCIGIVACGETPAETTPAGTTPAETTAPEGTTASSETTEVTTPVETTTEEPIVPPTPVEEETDHQSVSVGDYVTLRYNEMTCTVETEVKQGLGSKQEVSMTVKMKDGFLFDGWTLSDALVNGKANAASTDLTYTITVSEPTTVFVNTSMTVIYHPNGGASKTGGDAFETTFALTFYHNPKTLIENGSFLRDGYMLTSYSTEPDGTGKVAYLGNSIDAEGKAVLDLYCVWEKMTDESCFTVSGGKITGYTGDEENVVIPAKIGGSKVNGIAAGAFKNASMKRVVIGTNITSIDVGAFQACNNLEMLVIFDKGVRFGDDCFQGCHALTQLRICGTRGTYDFWAKYGAIKLDRLMWAKDKKKIVMFGGSGSYYGYDSAVIDEALNGEYVIVNYGENANVTSLIYFDIAEEFVGEDDILLWSPEPGSYTLGSNSIGNRFWAFMQPDYGFLEYVDDFTIYNNILSNFSSFLSEMSTGKFLPADSANLQTTLYGDNDAPNKTQGNQYYYDGEFDVSRRSVGPNIEGFVKNVQSKGAQVYFSFAAMQASGMLNVSEKEMGKYEDMFEDLGIISISNYKDCMYDNDLFFDSAWHMTREGQTVRSEHVAKDLVEQLRKEGKIS